jgi:hypothetical protein
MIKFQLEDEQHQTPSGWDKVPIPKFLKHLAEIAPQEPQELIDFVSAQAEYITEISKSETITKKEIKRLSNEHFVKLWDSIPKHEKTICHKYFSIEIGFWCDLEPSVIFDSMNLNQLELAFWDIQISLSIVDYQPDPNFTGFKIGKFRYDMPLKHMESSTAGEFAEAAGFEEKALDVAADRWEAVLDVMIVICRPKGEKYNYDKKRHEMRKNLFKKHLKTDVLINVAFFLLNLNSILRDNLLIYSLKMELSQKKAEGLGRSTDGL